MKCLILILLALPGLASAQETDAAPSRKVFYQKATEIDFTALNVDAELTRPSIEFYGEHSRPKFIPMTTVRKDFNPEMEASVHDVK